MTLGHSRHQFLYPCLAEDGEAWLTGHVAAFTFFGGVPRRVVLDNLTAGILKADRYDPRVNRAYGELTRYYGVLVDPARVRHPKDKAKVERNVSYARESFFVGRTWDNLTALRADAVRWCLTTAGLRTHGTTGEQPLRAFREREQASLQPLPTQPWEQVTWTTAKVQPDCHLRVGHASYSAPYRHIGERLDVRVGARAVALYAGEEVVTTHVRVERGRVSASSTTRRRGKPSYAARRRPCWNKPRPWARRQARSRGSCWGGSRWAICARSWRCSGCASGTTTRGWSGPADGRA